jgi:hypothetical protein
MLYDWKKTRIKRVGVKHNQFVFAHSSISNNSKVNERKLLCKNKLSNFRPIQKLWIITKSYNIQNASKRTSWLKISENIFLEIIQSTFLAILTSQFGKLDVRVFPLTFVFYLHRKTTRGCSIHSVCLKKKDFFVQQFHCFLYIWIYFCFLSNRLYYLLHFWTRFFRINYMD